MSHPPRRVFTGPVRYRRMPPPWLWAALLLVPLLVAAATWFVGGSRPAPTPDVVAATTTSGTSPVTGPSPEAGAPVDLRGGAKTVAVSAVVQDQGTRDRLLDAVHGVTQDRGLADETTIVDGRRVTDFAGLAPVVQAAAKAFDSFTVRLTDDAVLVRGVGGDAKDVAAVKKAAEGSLAGHRVQVVSDAPAAAGDAYTCDRLEQQISARLIEDPVMFELESARVDAASTQRLRDIGEALARCRSTDIRVNGHADATGPQALNVKLARQRAQSVRTILVGAGVPEKNVTAQGFGALRNIAPNDTPAGRQQNRRVVILVGTGAP